MTTSVAQKKLQNFISVAISRKKIGSTAIPHEKINQCLTDINRCLTDIFKI